MRKKLVPLVTAVVVVSAGEMPAQEAHVSELPEGTGLAARYSGDVGIDKDPAVVFVENFEAGTLDEIGRAHV